MQDPRFLVHLICLLKKRQHFNLESKSIFCFLFPSLSFKCVCCCCTHEDEEDGSLTTRKVTANWIRHDSAKTVFFHQNCFAKTKSWKNVSSLPRSCLLWCLLCITAATHFAAPVHHQLALLLFLSPFLVDTFKIIETHVYTARSLWTKKRNQALPSRFFFFFFRLFFSIL